MKYIALTIIAMLMTGVSASEWVTPTIISVKAFNTQKNQYIGVTNFTNPDNCEAGGLVILREENTDWKVMHATLMAGFLAGKTIRLRVDGCTSGIEHAIIDGVEIVR